MCGSHTGRSRDALGTQGSCRGGARSAPECARNGEFRRGCGCDSRRFGCGPRCRWVRELAAGRRARSGFRSQNHKIRPRAGRPTEWQRKKGMRRSRERLNSAEDGVTARRVEFRDAEGWKFRRGGERGREIEATT